MEIVNIKKESYMDKDRAVITVDIEVDRPRGYNGFDVFPDKYIPSLLVAVGRKYEIKTRRRLQKTNRLLSPASHS